MCPSLNPFHNELAFSLDMMPLLVGQEKKQVMRGGKREFYCAWESAYAGYGRQTNGPILGKWVDTQIRTSVPCPRTNLGDILGLEAMCWEEELCYVQTAKRL